MQPNDKVIMFVINSINVGGAAKILKFVANTCCDYFNKVYIISLIEKRKNYKIDTVQYIFINNRFFFKGVWRFEAIIKLRKLINLLSPDIVCSFVSDISFTTFLSLLEKKVTFIAAERGDPFSFNKVWDFLIKLSYNRADLCIFQTDCAKNYFDNKIKKKSKVIPNPYIPVENFTPYSGIRNKTIVSAGRFVKEKGFDNLIRAYAIVHELYPEYKLYIYGDGPLRRQLEDLINKNGLTKYISMPGYKDKIPLHIRKDGIFVLPSRFEGIPNVLIEAMAVGLPTISTNCTPGGPALLTENGRRGLLVPVDDVDALAKAIVHLIENTEIANYFSKAGLEVTNTYKPETIKKMWVDSFECCLK